MYSVLTAREYLIRNKTGYQDVKILTVVKSVRIVRERPLPGFEAPDRAATQGTLGRLCQGNTATNILGFVATHHLAQHIILTINN